MPKTNAQDILQRGVKSLLEEAKVPLRYHLKVVEALHKAMADHTNDRKLMLDTVNQVHEHLKGQEAERKHFKDTLEQVQKLPHLKGGRGPVGLTGYAKNGKPGAPGRPGRDAQMPSIDTLVEAILPRLPQPKAGKDAVIPDTKTVVEAVIRELQKGDKLHIKDIRGASGFMRDGIKYRFEELMHGGGSSSSITRSTDLSSQCNGTNKVFTIPAFTRIITLIATDAPVIYRPTVDFAATGTTLTMTASVNAPSAGATLILTYV